MSLWWSLERGEFVVVIGERCGCGGHWREVSLRWSLERGEFVVVIGER